MFENSDTQLSCKDLAKKKLSRLCFWSSWLFYSTAQCSPSILAQQVRDHSWTVRQKICTRGAFSWGGGERGKGSEGHGLPSLGNLGAKFSETSFPHFKTYRKIQKISPSKNKLPKLVIQKHLRYIAPPNIGPRGLLLGKCPQIQKTNKQSKNGTVPLKFFICQRTIMCAKVITVKKLWSCVKFAWLSFKKIHVLTASSVSKNSVQITDINFLPTIS